MTTKYFTVATVAAIFATLFAAAASAQSGTDLLQKGIYAQETLGDLDGAIHIYRQVTGSTAPKPIAAQAQYQLVLCMLQKGDRAAASHELDLLTHNFPDQQDFINKARKLIPGASTLLAPPWAEGEASQLNIKREGVFTGEYLYYSATPWRQTVSDLMRDPARNRDAIDNAQAIYLGWDLVTGKSTRSVAVKVDRDTMRHLEPPRFASDDLMGDVSASPFAGPAIDTDMLVFRMRLLPLAAGYKSTVSTLPFLLGHGTARSVELAVTAVEPVQTIAGKFNCYKVSFASLGQTFWIGVDGARPLVKFQSGGVEAELVKVWGPSALDDALAFLKTAGWSVDNVGTDIHGPASGANAASPADGQFRRERVDIQMRRIYSTPAEMDQAMQRDCSARVREIGRDATDVSVYPGSEQKLRFGGHPAVTCIIDWKENNTINPHRNEFNLWLHSESMVLRFTHDVGTLAFFRWIFEPILDTIKLP